MAVPMPEKQSLKIGEGKPGPGRRKGIPNRSTTVLKEAILQAAANAGGGDLVAYLTDQAKENPGPFLTLLGKVLPMQMVDADGQPISGNTTNVAVTTINILPVPRGSFIEAPATEAKPVVQGLVIDHAVRGSHIPKP